MSDFIAEQEKTSWSLQKVYVNDRPVPLSKSYQESFIDLVS